MNPLLGRRTVLRASGALALGSTLATVRPAAVAGTVFAHGVASGDPLPDGVLLWTRVTPTAAAQPGSRLGPSVPVRWEVATEPSFAAPVAAGTVRTGAQRDHTVKVDVTGLRPATDYVYRFRVAGETSPVGRTRTAPAADAAVERLRFGVVSCSNWQGGYFAAYRHLAQRGDLDAVLHLGDYLYEYAPGEYGARGVTVRPHDPPAEMVSLADYRRRHAQYKTDPDLAALHAAVPFITTWDDHESANDAYAGGAENHDAATEGDWQSRRAASWQAYSEWMPVRTEGDRLYRRLRYGLLAELSMLDLRRYRSQQVPLGPAAGGVDDPDRSITGTEQRNWLIDGLTGTHAQWKLVGNPVMITPVVFPPLPAELTAPVAEMLGIPPGGVPYNTDQWDGYTADRRAVLGALRDHGVRDTVFLTGDIHSSWACDVPIDAGSYPLSPSVATELVCTSVTSDNLDDILMAPPRTASLTVEAAFQASNRHVRYLEFDSHGASVLEVTPAAVQMDWYHLTERTDPDSTITHARSFRVRTGTQRVQATATPLTPEGRR